MRRARITVADERFLRFRCRAPGASVAAPGARDAVE
jgi:hypothetical protein